MTASRITSIVHDELDALRCITMGDYLLAVGALYGAMMRLEEHAGEPRTQMTVRVGSVQECSLTLINAIDLQVQSIGREDVADLEPLSFHAPQLHAIIRFLEDERDYLPDSALSPDEDE